MVGTVERETGAVATHQLANGERFQNSFAVAADGAYMVSDHALYAFTADPASGKPTVAWRAPYERVAQVLAAAQRSHVQLLSVAPIADSGG